MLLYTILILLSFCYANGINFSYSILGIFNSDVYVLYMLQNVTKKEIVNKAHSKMFKSAWKIASNNEAYLMRINIRFITKFDGIKRL